MSSRFNTYPSDQSCGGGTPHARKPHRPHFGNSISHASSVQENSRCRHAAISMLLKTPSLDTMTNKNEMVILIMIFLLIMVLAEASLSCQESGNNKFTVIGSKDCTDHSWQVNGIVVAHADKVGTHAREYISFNSRHTNVSYFCEMKNGTRQTIKCNQSEPLVKTTAAIGKPDEQHDIPTSNPESPASHGGIIGSIVLIGIIIVSGFVIWIVWQRRKPTENPHVYIPATQQQDTDETQM
ncbi:hypothetical protein AMEX_G8098 [Astyanax mexicanus]|uniref:Uncharacterized protein n=1 Tax=Astyanax mexicanus TaxID=7994 RepID=A0A8T2M1E1_ASTMX|nr:hypothetical protein AMEX_G8098 [Astyanax mexicanus]